MSLHSLYEGVIEFVIAYFLLANGIFFILLISSFLAIRKIIRKRPIIESFKERMGLFAPKVSIIAPAFNEESTIVQSVWSFLTLNYPHLEVVLVNDGSRDHTLEVLKNHYQLEAIEMLRTNRLSSTPVRQVYRSAIHPNFIVVDKENGGKADAINTGLAYSSSDLFCAVDSDSILDPDALLKVVIPFIENPELTIASGGTVRPINGSLVKHGRVERHRLPSSFLANIQIVEYLRAFLFGRLGWYVFNSTMIISGAFGLFKRDLVLAAGGYRSPSMAEDMELVVRLRRLCVEEKRDFDIAFVPDPVCWTEVPEKFSLLFRQRMRWQKGLCESLFHNKKMLFNWRFGFAGLVATPYFWIVELIGPFIELLSYLLVAGGLILGVLDYELLILFLFVDFTYGTFMSLSAVLLEETAFHKYPRVSQLLQLLAAALLENLGYRQFTSFVRMLAVFRALGPRDWGQMPRQGFSKT